MTAKYKFSFLPAPQDRMCAWINVLMLYILICTVSRASYFHAGKRIGGRHHRSYATPVRFVDFLSWGNCLLHMKNIMRQCPHADDAMSSCRWDISWGRCPHADETAWGTYADEKHHESLASCRSSMWNIMRHFPHADDKHHEIASCRWKQHHEIASCRWKKT